MAVVYVNKDNFEAEVLRADKPVLLDFYADWCGPCRMIAPVLDEIAAEYPEYKICKVNVDAEAELSEKFGVMSIPTLFVVKNGEVVNQTLGAQPKARLLALLA